MGSEKERDEQFDRAIEEGNLDLVRKFLEAGKSLNSWNVNHCTPLYSAVAKQNIDLVRFFLERGAEVNLSNRCNLGTPLHCACELGCCDLVKLLLESGADVNPLSGSNKNTALFVASERGHCDIVEVLLTNQAEVNQVNKRNEIALDIACQSGHTEVVKILLSCGANVNWSGRFEGTPLLYACEGNFYEIAKLLLDRGANVNPVGVNRHLHTPLYHAVLHGYTSLVELLLKRGAKINWPNGNGDIPLHGVCYKGHHVLANVLLVMGSEVNRRTVDGKSPLYLACAAGHSKIVEMLLDGGADVDEDIGGASDLAWQTPLYVALREGCREMITMLLNTDVNLSYPYDKDHPSGKTIANVRTMLFYDKIIKRNAIPSAPIIDVTGKSHANKLIQEHLTKLKVAGLIDTGILEEDLFLVKCIAELEHINSFKIFKNVKLGIVFKMAKYPLYQKNQELMDSLEDYLCSWLPYDEFPIYANILRNTLRKSKQRLPLLTSASKVLQDWQPQIPILILENILKYMDEADLKSISSFE